MATPRRADSHRTAHTPYDYRYLAPLPRTTYAGDMYRTIRRTSLLPSSMKTKSPPTPTKPTKKVRFKLPAQSKTVSTPRAAHRATSPPTVIRQIAYDDLWMPPLHFNVEYSPAFARPSSSPAPFSSAQRKQLATSAPISRMRMRSDALPWTLEVHETTQGDGVRLGDVIDAISRSLRRPVRANEYDMLDTRSRAKVARAFRARAARSGREYAPAVHAHGLLRLDFLCGRTMLLGLSPSHEPNTWNLVFGAPATL